MRPRQSATAAGGASPAAGRTIADLPDDLLVRCLATLTQEERFQHASPVCQRFRRLCLAPQLLHTVVVTCLYSNSAIRRASSLLAFLMAHVSHIRCLDVRMPHDVQPGQDMQLAQLMASCFSVCGAAGHLEELDASGRMLLASAAWLPGLTALRKLRLFTSEPLLLPPEVSRLRELTDMFFRGGPLLLAASSQLPSGLVSLRLEGEGHSELLPQMSALSALSCLMLVSLPGCLPGSMEPLSGLPALRDLMLSSVKPLPPSLASLTQLEQLIVSYCSDHAVLEAALPRLRRLTALYVGVNLYNQADNQETLPRIPSTIAHLPRLQRLLIERSPGMLDPSLPSGGPWLQSLQWLGLPWHVLEAGAGVMCAAPQLRYIYSLGTPHIGAGAQIEDPQWQVWCTFWEFVATHTPLRCLAYFTTDQDCTDGITHEDLVDAAFMLNHRRPGLRLRRFERDEAFFDEMLSCADIPPGPGTFESLEKLDRNVRDAQARRR